MGTRGIQLKTELRSAELSLHYTNPFVRPAVGVEDLTLAERSVVWLNY
jgi:hypothetical protein